MKYCRALQSLDTQGQMIKDGTHPRLVWMIEELAKRQERLLTRLEGRYE